MKWPGSANPGPMTHGRTMISNDSFWLLAFGFLLLASTSVLLVSRTWWAVLPALAMQATLFVGLMEAFHQSVHNNLHSNRLVNDLIGRVLGAHLGFQFTCYKRFHGRHHARLNKHDDPEKLLYVRQISRHEQLLAPGWQLLQSTRIVNTGQFLLPSDESPTSYELWANYVFKIVIITLTVAYPVAFILAYWLPFILFSYVESILAQSQHYFWTETCDGRKVDHKASLNIELPAAIRFMMLNTNYHATHHIAPRTKWYKMHAASRSLITNQSVPTLTFSAFFHSWRLEPRRWKTHPDHAPIDRAIDAHVIAE